MPDEHEKDWFYYWLMDNWVISSGESVGKPYRFWPDYPFMVAYAKDTSPRKVAIKCAQVGLSEISIAELYAWCDHTNGNAMYVFPTDTIAVEFSRARLVNAHRINPYLEQFLSANETIRQFKFKDNWVYIRGASVTERDGRQYRRQLITVDASHLFGDEVDEWSPGVFPSLQSRVGASAHPIERYLSVPRLADGGISKVYGLSDKKVWTIKCRHCNEWQELTLFDNITNYEYPALEHKVICRKCTKNLNRLENESGFAQWVAEAPESNRGFSGYHFSKLFFPRADINMIVERFNDPESAQDCWNDDLGLPFEPESKKIADKDLRRCAAKDDEYWESLLKEVEYSSIGVDVGKSLHYVVRSKISGDREILQEFGTVQTFSDIEEIIGEHNIRCGIFDAQPDFDASSSMCDHLENKDKGTFKVAYFDTTAKERTIIRYDNQNPVVVHVGRNLAMGKVLKEFVAAETIIPPFYQHVDNGRFVQHMKEPVRVFRKNSKTGILEASFPKSRRPDHYFFATLYSKVALELTPDDLVITRRSR